MINKLTQYFHNKFTNHRFNLSFKNLKNGFTLPSYVKDSIRTSPFHFMFNNIKLKNKLMISYFILILVPLGLLTIISYQQVNKFTGQQIMYSAQQSLEQTYSFLSYKIEKVVDVLDIISTDDKIQNILVSSDDYKNNLPKQLGDMDTLTQLLKSYQKNNDVYSVKLYIDDDLLYAQENVNLLGFSSCKGRMWFEELEKSRWATRFFPSSEMVKYISSDIPNSTLYPNISDKTDSPKTISVVKGIRDFNNYQKIIAVIRIDILESTIQDIVKKANSTKGGVAYLQNSRGITVASSSSILSDKWKLEASLCNKNGLSNSWFEDKIDKVNLRFGCMSVPETDWNIVSVIPTDEILGASKAIRNQMFLLMIILGLAAYVLAYIISKSSVKRISQVINKMKKVQNGDLNVIINTSSKDEIGELIDNFNYMVKKIDVLVDEQYRLGINVKNAELKALQAQINPHFLYNTLDMINWSAIRNKIPEISSIVKSLAKFYKLSLSKGKESVPLGNEIEHVLLYIDIQNKRFENKITTLLDIDEEIYKYSIIKILLQPIVENSILHGIMEKENKSGTIEISAKLENHLIKIKIVDDGVGIPKQKLETLLIKPSSNPTRGFGVQNVNNRIKLFYGDKYGISYKSAVGVGTEVEIIIPAILYDENNES